MLDKIKIRIKNYAKNPFWQNFRDARFLGFVVFGVLMLLASWSGVQVIETNYVLQKEIAQLDQQNQVKELANANQKLQNEFYKTDTYLELQARKAFGKGAPGEKLLLVPKDVALSYAKELPDTKKQDSTREKPDTRSNQRKNFDAWMNFLFHKNG